MRGGLLGYRRVLPACAAAFSLLGVAGVSGAVSQPPPDSTPLPQPVPPEELNIILSRSFPESAITLSGLFSFRGESLDPSADAVALPGTFRPLCETEDTEVTAEFVLHGGGCTLGLAWYNANGSPPPASELYEAVPSTVTLDMECILADFCPLASPPMIPFVWNPIVYHSPICADPRYTGGEIGFALVANPSSPCTATKYSEHAANVVCTSCTPNTPWITALVYRSNLRTDGYYLAFEDLPMSPVDWQATTGLYAPEGDFNDFVFHLTGVCHGEDECMAGGGNGGTGGSSSGGSSTGGSATGGSSSGGSSTGGSATGGSSTGGSSTGGSGDTGGSVTGGAAGDGEGGTSGSSSPTCAPGREVPCSCSDGRDGSQRCRDNGRGFEACSCDDDDDEEAGGCGCRAGTQGESGAWLFIALALVALGRRSDRTVS